MRMVVLLLLVAGTMAWVCAPHMCVGPGIVGSTRAGIVLRADESDAAAAIQKRLKMVLLEEEGKKKIERREKLAPMVAADLANVRKYGGVSGTPGCMMGMPDIGA